MTEYNQYVTAVNKIFECVTKMKQALQNPDNQSMIENIEQYKKNVVDSANMFSKDKTAVPAVEGLDDD